MYSQKNCTGQRMLNSMGILLFLLSADTYEIDETFQDCLTCPEMVVVPKDDEEGWDDERPQHQVTISKPSKSLPKRFWMMKL